MNFNFLIEQISGLNEEAIEQFINEFVDSNPSNDECIKLVEACKQGMVIIANRYENRKYFVGDMIFAGELLSIILDRIKPIIGECKTQLCEIRLGSIYGPSKATGERIFKRVFEEAGFKVIQSKERIII